MSLLSFVWGSKTRKLVTSVTAAFGLVAAFGGAVKAWPDIKPLMPAQRYYVDDTTVERIAELKSVVTPQLKELKTWKLEDFISKQDDRLNSLNAESTTIQSKLPTENDPQVKAIFNNRLKAISVEKARVQERKSKWEDQLKQLQAN
jgi:hypothetical protein